MRPQHTHNLNKLSARDRQVLEHVARYRLTTIDVLRHTVLTGISRNAAGKVASRLCRAELLAKYTLLHPVRYYVIGSESADMVGVSSRRVLPLGPQALPIEYAVLVYATLGRQERRRLTTNEILQQFPWLPPALAAAPHCWNDRQSLLELVRVDLGGPAGHLARKAAHDLTLRRRFKEFLPLVQSGGFRLVVITATKARSQALRTALDQHDWPRGLQVHLSIVPLLLSLTARFSRP